jgi:hypothetical protein
MSMCDGCMPQRLVGHQECEKGAMRAHTEEFHLQIWTVCAVLLYKGSFIAFWLTCICLHLQQQIARQGQQRKTQ